MKTLIAAGLVMLLMASASFGAIADWTFTQKKELRRDGWYIKVEATHKTRIDPATSKKEIQVFDIPIGTVTTQADVNDSVALLLEKLEAQITKVATFVDGPMTPAKK